MLWIVSAMCKINKFSLSEKVTNILEKLVSTWPSVFMTSLVKVEVIDFRRKTLVRPSLAIIIDVSKENKVSVLAKDVIKV